MAQKGTFALRLVAQKSTDESLSYTTHTHARDKDSEFRRMAYRLLFASQITHQSQLPMNVAMRERCEEEGT
jgi:hypothetical protein